MNRPLRILLIAAPVIVVVAANWFLQNRHRDAVAQVATSALSVDKAVATPVDSRVEVTGFVFLDEELARPLLCSHRTRSDRPACAGATAVLASLDHTRLDLEIADEPKGGYDAWSRNEVTLEVVAKRGVLIVEEIVR